MTDPPQGTGSAAAADERRPAGSGADADGTDGYNTGTDADRRKALDSIYDYNKVVITIATGTLALTATFLGKDLYQGTSLPMIVASWTCLGVSILFGIVGMGAYISQYSESDIRPRRSGVEYLSLVQVVGLISGLLFLGLFAIHNARSRPSPTTPTPSPTTSVSPADTSGTSGSPEPTR